MPVITLLSMGLESNHATANSASVCPRSPAQVLSVSAMTSLCGVRARVTAGLPAAPRVPGGGGSPGRYLPVKTPAPKGK